MNVEEQQCVESGLESAVARDSPSDERLFRMIVLIAKREPSALAQLYDATAGRVYGLALRILKDTPSAEEVVSDVYLQVWRTAGTYSPARGTVITWLLMICRSRSLDAMRARNEPLVFLSPLEGVAETSDDPMDILAATQRTSDVHIALAALDPLPRQLIALAFFRGYTHQEIAASTGMPLGSVKSLIRRALTRLRAGTNYHAEA